MSFLKGIFGKDQKSPTTVPAGKAAPPARPFPAGFSADGQQQQQQQRRPSAYDQQHYPPAHLQQQPPQPAAASVAEQPSTGGGGGMDDFDLFDGLSLKVATPAPVESQQQPPSQPASTTNGHSSGLAHDAPTVDAASSGGDPMDMFSGLTVASADLAPSVGPAETISGGESGGSLLSMLNADDGAATTDSQTNEASSFSFVSESAAQPADDAPADAGSSFSFLTSSSEDAAQPDSHADAPPPLSVVDHASPSMSTHTSPSKAVLVDSHPATPSAVAATPAQSAVTPAATPAASKSSAAPTFEQVHAQLDSALTSYWDDLKSLSLTHSALRSQQIGLQTTLKDTQSQLAALESQQQSEIEAENYEGADQINSQIEAIKAQLSMDGRELQRIDAAIAQQEGNKAALRSRTVAVLDECVRNLQLISKQFTFQTTHFVTTETQALEQKEDILITNLEKTRRNLAHTATDLAAIAVDEERIAAQIAVDTKEMSEEHEQLQTQLSALEIERDELRRLLQAKEDEVAMCTQKIDVVTTGIANKKAAHDKKLGRILEKKTRTQNEREQAAAEEVRLLAAKEALEADFGSIANQEKNSNKRLKKMQEEAAFIQNVVMQKLVQKEEATNAGAPSPSSGSSSGGSSELQALRTRLASTLSSLESSRAQLSSLDSSIESLSRQIDSVSSKIPALDAAKSTAVASRDFKRAAAVNAEIKTLQTNKAEMEARLDDLKAEAAALNEQLSTLAETKASLTGEIVHVESESDKRRLSQFLQQRLLLSWKNKQVDKLMRKNAQEREEEASAVAGSTAAHAASFALSHHFSYLSHELQCNTVEVELLTKEIDELRKKHGWDEEFMQSEAKEEMDARRRANNEPPVDDDEQTTSSSAAVDGSLVDGADAAEEESSISEQRRKDRNAAIAAAAAANAADAAPQADEAGAEVEGSRKNEEAAVAAPEESVAQAEEEGAAASPIEANDSTEAAESSEAVPATEEAAASGSDAAAPAADASEPSEPAEPAAPAPPSPSLIASLRSSHSALLAEIESLEQDLARAVESEDFEAAASIDEQLPLKRDEKLRIETQAEELGIQLQEEKKAEEEGEQQQQPEQEEQAQAQEQEE